MGSTSNAICSQREGVKMKADRLAYDNAIRLAFASA